MNVRQMGKKLRAEARDNVARAKAGAKQGVAAIPLARRLVSAVRKAGGDPSAWLGYSGGVYVNVSMQVNSFKSPELVRVLEAAIEVLGEANISSSDYAGMSLREYKVAGGGVHFEVNANLEGEGSPLCRRVKIGEEVKVVNQYEFRCD